MGSSDRQTPAKVVGFWIFKMEKMYGALFSVLEVPNLKIKKPTWFHQPSAMTVFAVVLLSYFMVTGGIIYDVIVDQTQSTTLPKFNRLLLIFLGFLCIVISFLA